MFFDLTRTFSTAAEVNDILAEDLNLTTALLKQHPKVYWIWNHRRWCLEHVPEGPTDEDRVGWKMANWNREIFVVEKMLDVDARNCALFIRLSRAQAEQGLSCSSCMELPSLRPRNYAGSSLGGFRAGLYETQDRSKLFEFQCVASTIQNPDNHVGKP